MMKLKVFEVNVKPYDDYATVTEAYEGCTSYNVKEHPQT